MTRWLSHGILILFAGVANAERIESIPHPGRYAIDTTGSIQPGMLAVIERVGNQIGHLSKGKMVVAIISTTSGKNHRLFARELFRSWEVIDTGKYNESFGILLALDDDAIEIVVDSSIEIPQSRLDRIIADRMRRHLDEGKPGLAVLDGARSYCDENFRFQVIVNDLLRQEGVDEALEPRPPEPSKKDPGSVRRTIVNRVLLGLCGCVAVYFVGRHLRRYRGRNCPDCEMPMKLLSEEDEDTHLSTSEVLEETLKSVNYDVWMCTSCSRTQSVRFGAFFSKYSKCPTCGSRTKSVSTSLISSPTNVMSGSKEVTESCDNCDYYKQYLRSIPRTGS